MDKLKELLNGFGPWEQSGLAATMWVVSHISVGTGIAAFFVVLFSLKSTYYRGKADEYDSKLAKIKYDKACQGQIDSDS